MPCTFFPHPWDPQHTTHIPSDFRVCYRHHPLYDKEVRIIQRHPYRNGVIVVLPDGSPCELPAWMLDPIFCMGLSEETDASLSLQALRNLRHLLDTHPLSSLPPLDKSKPSSKSGGKNARKAIPPNDAVGENQQSLEETTSRDTKPMSQTGNRSVGKDCNQRSKRKETQR